MGGALRQEPGGREKERIAVMYQRMLNGSVFTMPSWCTLRVLLKVTLILPLFIGVANCRSSGVRHNHGRHRHISRNYNYDTSQYSQQMQSNSVKPQEVRQVYHTYQRGSVKVPYHGATVNVPASHGPKKMYRGTITTTFLDRKPSAHRLGIPHRNLGSNSYKHRDTDWELSRDEPARSNETPCARCPRDRAVIAKRGSITTIMERLPLTPCFPWSSIDDLEHEVMLGPQPGQIVTEGTHSLVTRVTHNDHPIATCHAMYSVIVRKCEPINADGLVKVICPLGQAWGASCYFSCPDGYQLIGANSSECNDHLEWSNSPPFCAVTTSCTVPIAPANGHMTCRTPHHRPVRSQSVLPDGTICHYLCSNGYRIPKTQSKLAAVQCFAGKWNSTQDPTCIETEVSSEQQNELKTHSGHHILTSTRFGRKHCPKGLCQNGGTCYIILGEPLCLCQQGYTGSSCTEFLDENSLT
ncbi:uncharacterized protein LOC142321781 [Lycorma delicatula]|uniref:uncharacterized protein LOC142321781 n=1 Tax=Lycorma delicatula TaxID=130591 RepID=UPI003F5179D1